MPSPYCEIFQRLSRPLEPIPTGRSPVLKRLAGIRAVLFDVYGTMLVSGSGDVGTADVGTAERPAGPDPPPQCPSDVACALDDALWAVGIPPAVRAGGGAELLFQTIEASHARARGAGIDYPEVDIVAVWSEVLAELARRGVIDERVARAADPRRLAVEYEARVNPCWPMPHLPECLGHLRRAGLVLGLVSNAQFYTPELFEALLGSPTEAWGFPLPLQCYSYGCGVAKPGLAMFRQALAVLAERGIGPGEVLYVGNDMLNDVWPATRLGLRTALFAGDARSLRLRGENAEVAAISPDLVLTDLAQIAECMMV